MQIANHSVRKGNVVLYYHMASSHTVDKVKSVCVRVNGENFSLFIASTSEFVQGRLEKQVRWTEPKNCLFTFYSVGVKISQKMNSMLKSLGFHI